MILLKGGAAGTRRLGVVGALVVALIAAVVLSGLAVLALAGLALAAIGAAVVFLRRVVGAGAARTTSARDPNSLELEPDFEVLPATPSSDPGVATPPRLRSRESTDR